METNNKNTSFSNWEEKYLQMNMEIVKKQNFNDNDKDISNPTNSRDKLEDLYLKQHTTIGKTKALSKNTVSKIPPLATEYVSNSSDGSINSMLLSAKAESAPLEEHNFPDVNLSYSNAISQHSETKLSDQSKKSKSETKLSDQSKSKKISNISAFKDSESRNDLSSGSNDPYSVFQIADNLNDSHREEVMKQARLIDNQKGDYLGNWEDVAGKIRPMVKKYHQEEKQEQNKRNTLKLHVCRNNRRSNNHTFYSSAKLTKPGSIVHCNGTTHQHAPNGVKKYV